MGLICISWARTRQNSIMLCSEDKMLIPECVLHKGWAAGRIMKEFPTKNGFKLQFKEFLKKSVKKNLFWIENQEVVVPNLL